MCFLCFLSVHGYFSLSGSTCCHGNAFGGVASLLYSVKSLVNVLVKICKNMYNKPFVLGLVHSVVFVVVSL